MSKEIKIVEIVNVGCHSLLGAMALELSADHLIDYDKYKWIIAVNSESIEVIQDQCTGLLLTDYMIIERRTMIITKDFKNK